MRIINLFSGGRHGWQPAWAVMAAILVTPSILMAHSMVLWAYMEKGHVYVEAYSSSGAKIMKGNVIVLDAGGKKLLEGKVDEQGKFNSDPPIKDDMTILLIVDGTHRSEFKIKAWDFQGDATK